MQRSMRSGVFSLLVSTLCCAPVAPAQPFAPRLCEVATETGLPHLEENLRYATTHSKPCIGRAQLATAFPILQHEALRGCKLDHERSAASSVHLLLSCEAGNSPAAATLLGVSRSRGARIARWS